MKADIHPEYNEVTVPCACGVETPTRSTQTYTVDLCDKCHPFYTGKQRFVDRAGMVERYNRRYGKTMSQAEAESRAEAETKAEAEA